MVAFMSAWRWKGKTLALLLTAAILAGLLGVLGAVPAQAAIQDRPVFTWNMQGATNGNDNKWTWGVGPRLNDPRQPVMALQEVGAHPPTSAYGTEERIIEGGQLADLPEGMIEQLPDAINARRVRYTQWSNNHMLYHVYFLQTDAQNQQWVGGRCNLAIVLPREARQVAIVPTPNGARGHGQERAALGVLLGTTWYFSIHAGARENNNAPGHLANIEQFIEMQDSREIEGREAIVTGDFNREPETIPQETQQVIATPPGTVTHFGSRGGSRYDYAVMIEPDGLFPDNIEARVHPSGYSDHRPVEIHSAFIPEPDYSAFPVYGSPRVIQNVQAGGVLTAAESKNFGRISSAAQSSEDLRDAWKILAYPNGTVSFKNEYSGRCLDTANHTHFRPDSGIPIGQYDCSSRVTDLWYPRYLGNDEYMLESIEKPNLCVSLGEGQTDPTSITDAILAKCENVPSQRFFFSPSNLSNEASGKTPNLTELDARGPVSLQNMYNGGVMDVQGQGSENNTAVISYSRFNGQKNQGWRIVQNAGGTVSFVSEASGKCLDIHNSDTATRGRELVIFDCQGQTSQQWRVTQLTDEQWQFSSLRVDGACIGAPNASANPRSGNASVTECAQNGTHTFTLTPFDPTGTPSLPTDPDTD
ncbi:RICIN domain-containing protein [Streptomyces sp. NPDC056007]|uniref:RICIN domain-containing protein n=1 Tax=Streptomyces sp. NPDC056007 TaxID=3345678 RepID=UPI0035DA33BD